AGDPDPTALVNPDQREAVIGPARWVPEPLQPGAAVAGDHLPGRAPAAKPPDLPRVSVSGEIGHHLRVLVQQPGQLEAQRVDDRAVWPGGHDWGDDRLMAQHVNGADEAVALV